MAWCRSFYNSHIIFVFLSGDLKFMYTRQRNEIENSYGHGRRENYFQINHYYFSDNGTV